MDLGTLSRLKIINLRKKELVALFKLSCDCLLSATPPHGVIGCSGVGDCDISQSYFTYSFFCVI